MAKIPGTAVASPLVPIDSSSTTPTHSARYGKGGLRGVATIAALDDIPVTYREHGMLVFVEALGAYYQCGPGPVFSFGAAPFVPGPSADTIYPNTSSGLAVVGEGEYFYVATSEGLKLYRDVAGVASFIGDFPSLATLSAEVAAAAASVVAAGEAQGLAEDARDEATEQAGIATTQAGIATNQAGIAANQAGEATNQAGIAGGHATQSGIFRDQARAAADATAPQRFFDTYADALAAISTIPDDAVIEVFEDETQDDYRTRYLKEPGNLVLKIRFEADSIATELASTDPGKGAQLVANSIVKRDTVAQMQALTGLVDGQRISVGGYYAVGDGGGGEFYYDADSEDTANGGTVFDATGMGGGRLFRKSEGTVKVEWFGARGTGLSDDRLAMQKSLDYVGSLPSGGVVHAAQKYLIVPVIDGSDIYVGLDMPSNVRLVLDGDILVPDDVGSDSYEILSSRRTENVAIGGAGRIFGDRDGHVDREVGPNGFGISFWGVDGCHIFGDLKIYNCWGDGIYIRRGGAGSVAPLDSGCRGLTIDPTVLVDNCRRNGLSLVGCIQSTIAGIYKNTNGNAPECGIDFEPTAPGVVEDIIFGDVFAVGNAGRGVQLRDAARVSGGTIHAISNGRYGFLVNTSDDVAVSAFCSANGVDPAPGLDYDNMRITGSSNIRVDLFARGNGETPGYGLFVQSGCSNVQLGNVDVLGGGALGDISVQDLSNIGATTLGKVNVVGDVNGPVRKLIGPWVAENIASGGAVTGVQIPMFVYAGPVTGLPAVRPGSITGIIVRTNEPRTAGTCSVDATINGVGVGLTATLSAANTTFRAIKQGSQVDTYAEGDVLGVALTNTSTWTPTTADIVVMLEVVE